jgi:hypothetical protein
LARRPVGKRLVGRSRHRWEDIIKIDLKDVGNNGVEGPVVALVNTVMNLLIP